MNIEQAINYLKSTGMSDEQIIEVADALTKGAISQLRAEILNFKEKCNASDYLGCGILEIFDKYAESEENNGTL